MSRRTFAPFSREPLAEPIDSIDRCIKWMLAALLLFGPASLGAVQGWSEALFDALALGMLLLAAVKRCRRPAFSFGHCWPRRFVTWPIAIFVGLVCLQLMELPGSVVTAISPATATLRSRLLADAPTAAKVMSTISLYPEATWHDLRSLIAVISVFLTVLTTIRSVDQVRRLMRIVAVIGGAFALLSLVQIATGAQGIYWTVAIPGGHAARSGPFINHSHFGQWMNLSIGSMLGLLLDALHSSFRRRDYTADEIVAKLSHRTAWPIWVLIGSIGVSAAAVAFSLSRGALLGMAVAAIVIGSAFVTRRDLPKRGWIAGGLLALITAILLLDASTLLDRFGGHPLADMQGNRLQILRDLLPAWRQFPVFGTGLGSFARVFPMFDRSTYAYFASHAENEYAQLLTETGAVGLACVIAFTATAITSLVIAIRDRGTAADRSSASLALGLGFGLIAILVHSFSDFGQHVYAVAALTAVTSGLLINLATLRIEEVEPAERVPIEASRYRRLVGIAQLIAVGLVAMATLFQAVRVWQADDAWQTVRRIDADLQARDWIADNAEYSDLLDAADTAASLRPGNVEYRYWLNFYRWKAIARARDANGKLPLTEQSSAYVHRIVDELLYARQMGPTYGQLPLLAGQLEFELLHERRELGLSHLKAAFELSGPDPRAALVYGEALASEGKLVDVKPLLDRAALLDPGLVGEIAEIYLKSLHRPDLAVEVAGANPEALESVIAVIAKSNSDSTLLATARERLFKLIQVRAMLPTASLIDHLRMARALVERSDDASAINYFQKAMAVDFTRVDVRLELAGALVRLERYADAMREVERVLRSDPANVEVLTLKGKIEKRSK